ncbi:MAG: FAD-binding domain-containing protein [Lysobacterales bacterium]
MSELDLVWFKRDLRLADHAPTTAGTSSRGVLGLYVFEPGYWQAPDTSARQFEFLCESLRELAHELSARGGALEVHVGDVGEVLRTLHARYSLGAVHSHEETGNGWTYDRDRRVATILRELGLPWHQYRQFGVVRGLRRRQGWAQQWETLIGSPCHEDARGTRWVRGNGELENCIEQMRQGLAPDPCPGRQAGGRRAALELLQGFLDQRGLAYHRQMSSPLTAATACSRLSAHLSLGNLSLRELVQAVRARRAQLRAQPRLPPELATQPRALQAFESRLHWHCHFMQKLESEPQIEFHNIHRGFDGMREDDFDHERFAAFREARTGWPFVDACLRMLDHEGWINFRMRAMLMAVSSYHLWLHWREPALFLARRFVDYEPGIHYSQAQMQSGVTGINIPRIYNPIKQSLDQDPDGQFIRHWLPELSPLPVSLIHAPFRMSLAEQQRHGVILERDYPRPIVDHEQAAREAKARLTAWRRRPGMYEQSRAVMDKHGSRKRRMQRALPSPSPQADLFGDQA